MGYARRVMESPSADSRDNEHDDDPRSETIARALTRRDGHGTFFPRAFPSLPLFFFSFLLARRRILFLLSSTKLARLDGKINAELSDSRAIRRSATITCLRFLSLSLPPSHPLFPSLAAKEDSNDRGDNRSHE